jgi:Cu/Ag efflux protein CusF
MNRFSTAPLVVSLAVTIVVASSVVPARAQNAVSQAATVSKTFVIDAIDHSSRIVTLRDDAGETETIVCGPDVQRFDALKVGDKVTFRYHESVVYQIRKPGSTGAAQEGAAIVRTPGNRPGGTISQQATATVTVTAVDTKIPSVTVTTSDGKKMSFKVEDPKNLQGVKAGDRVEITYTQALAISVAPSGK